MHLVYCVCFMSENELFIQQANKDLLYALTTPHSNADIQFFEACFCNFITLKLKGFPVSGIEQYNLPFCTNIDFNLESEGFKENSLHYSFCQY